MASTDKVILTNAGKQLFNDSLDSNPVTFTKIVFSSDNYQQSDDNTVKALTDLTNHEVTANTVTSLIDGITNVRGIAYNESLTQSYYVNTFGLYAKDNTTNEVLVAVVCSSSADYLPAFNGQSKTQVTYTFKFKVDDDVVIKFDDAHDVPVTLEDVQNATSGMNASITANTTSVASLANSTSSAFASFAGNSSALTSLASSVSTAISLNDISTLDTIQLNMNNINSSFDRQFNSLNNRYNGALAYKGTVTGTLNWLPQQSDGYYSISSIANAPYGLTSGIAIVHSGTAELIDNATGNIFVYNGGNGFTNPFPYSQLATTSYADSDANSVAYSTNSAIASLSSSALTYKGSFSGFTQSTAPGIYNYTGTSNNQQLGAPGDFSGTGNIIVYPASNNIAQIVTQDGTGALATGTLNLNGAVNSQNYLNPDYGNSPANIEFVLSQNNSLSGSLEVISGAVGSISSAISANSSANSSALSSLASFTNSANNGALTYKGSWTGDLTSLASASDGYYSVGSNYNIFNTTGEPMLIAGGIATVHGGTLSINDTGTGNMYLYIDSQWETIANSSAVQSAINSVASVASNATSSVASSVASSANSYIMVEGITTNSRVTSLSNSANIGISANAQSVFYASVYASTNSSNITSLSNSASAGISANSGLASMNASSLFSLTNGGIASVANSLINHSSILQMENQTDHDSVKNYGFDFVSNYNSHFSIDGWDLSQIADSLGLPSGTTWGDFFNIKLANESFQLIITNVNTMYWRLTNKQWNQVGASNYMLMAPNTDLFSINYESKWYCTWSTNLINFPGNNTSCTIVYSGYGPHNGLKIDVIDSWGNEYVCYNNSGNWLTWSKIH